LETTQLPQVSVSGRIVIEGQLPASVGANPENAPAPPSPARWRFWRWPPESVLAAATVVLAVATFFPAAFTLALVHVASNQTQILSATDQVLHKTANATDEMRILSEATERAWIGPFRAASEPFTAGTAVKISIDYTNTGRLPASFMFAAQAQFLSEQRWNAGEATNMIVPLHKLRCIQNLPNLSDTLKSVAYLTTGLSFYTWTYDSNNPKLLVDSRKAYPVVPG